MGKKKSTTRKPAKKVKQTLDITFTCLFCNHERSVSCTLDKKIGIGELHCKICGQNFQSTIHSLSKPVDVYSDWIDACEDLEEEAKDVNAGIVDDNYNSKRDEDYSGDEDDEFARGKARDPILDSDDDDY